MKYVFIPAFFISLCWLIFVYCSQPKRSDADRYNDAIDAAAQLWIQAHYSLTSQPATYDFNNDVLIDIMDRVQTRLAAMK